MLFSIIIPIYKFNPHIQKSIESAINQKFSSDKFEVILVNDGSKDDFSKIINKFKNFNNFKYFKLKKNKGPGIARNYGISRSKGKYIYFLDSDDYIKKDTLKKFNTIIKKNNVDLICNNFEVKNLYDRKIKNYRFDLSLLKETKKKIINHYLELSIIPQVISNLVRKEIITKNKILFKSDVYEDIFYFFRLVFFAKRIHVINEKLYMKNNTKKSITNNFSLNHVNLIFRAYEDIYRFLKIRNFYNREKILFTIVGISAFIITQSKKFNKKKRDQFNSRLIYLLKRYRKDLKLKYAFKTKKDLIVKKFLSI
tara:strand:- start:307 stop:1236 length:930 start_codon:yes stop_codon:yes gene_type:complete